MESILCWPTTPRLGPALECNWYTQRHSTGEQWFLLSQQGATANSFLARDEIFATISLLSGGILPELNLGKSLI